MARYDSVDGSGPVVFTGSAFPALSRVDHVVPRVFMSFRAMSLVSVARSGTNVFNSGLKNEASERIHAQSVPAIFASGAEPLLEVSVMTGVSNVHPLGDGAMEEFPGESMGVSSFGSPPSFQSNSSVAIGERFARPHPMRNFGSPVNSVEKSICHGFGFTAHTAQYNPNISEGQINGTI